VVIDMAGASNTQANILRSLAMGINPITGELFPDGLIDQPDVIRALFLGAAVLDGWDDKESRKECVRNPDGQALREKCGTSIRALERQLAQQYELEYQNRGTIWTKEQDSMLETMYYDEEPVVSMIEAFGRTSRGIAARLVRLGIIENRKVFYEYAKKSAMGGITLRRNASRKDGEDD